MQHEDIRKIAEQSDGSWISAEDAESTGQLLLRAERVLNVLLAKHAHDRVLVVAHGWFNRALIAVLQGLSEEDFPGLERLDNTSVCVFDVDEARNHTMHAHNCTKHLD